MILSAHIPVHGKGQTIGIYGGSFNPPHLGHRHVAILALNKLKLDAVWVLVSPQNPLKSSVNTPVEQRLTATQTIMAHPKIHVLNIEQFMNSNYTFDTVQQLQNSAKTVHFIYIMGADNFCTLHRWYKWQNIMRSIPICVVDRPNYMYKSLHSIAAIKFGQYRVQEYFAHELPLKPAPAWLFLHGKLNPTSSTTLRMKAYKNST